MSVLHGLALGCRLVIPTDTVLATGAAAKGAAAAGVAAAGAGPGGRPGRGQHALVRPRLLGLKVRGGEYS